MASSNNYKNISLVTCCNQFWWSEVENANAQFSWTLPLFVYSGSIFITKAREFWKFLAKRAEVIYNLYSPLQQPHSKHHGVTPLFQFFLLSMQMKHNSHLCCSFFDFLSTFSAASGFKQRSFLHVCNAV